VSFIDSLMLYLAAIGTADGYVVLDTASTPTKLVNAKFGYDAANKRATFTGTFTPAMSGNINTVYFTVLSPSGQPVAELQLSNLKSKYNLSVNQGVAYRIIVSIIARQT